MKLKIMLADDDDLFRRSLRQNLYEEYEVIETSNGKETIEHFNVHKPDVLFLDITMPEMDGVDVLRHIHQSYPNAIVIMLTAVGKIDMVVECMKLGAFDYMTKPINFDELYITIKRCQEALAVRNELMQRRMIQKVENEQYELIGDSAAIAQIREAVKVIAPSDAIVLLEGETGTGKEVIARIIHQQSRRSESPFIAINCGAIPKELFEAEFFGYKKGAFTGAQKDMDGKFKLAHQGTLLLDEIGEMPLDMQTKLLRVLDRREFYPVGSENLVRVNVRIVTSTNRNLLEMVKRGEFRQDLFYRLNVYRLAVPSLRSRKEDILPLANYYLLYYCDRLGKNIQAFTSEASEYLLHYHWPGNIRELRNAIERIVITCPETYVEKKHLVWLDTETETIKSFAPLAFQIPAEGIDFEEFEKDILEKALKMSGGNKSKAAKLLKMSTQTFYYRFEKFGLKKEI